LQSHHVCAINIKKMCAARIRLVGRGHERHSEKKEAQNINWFSPLL
jgi:hypothetical protein